MKQYDDYNTICDLDVETLCNACGKNEPVDDFGICDRCYDHADDERKRKREERE